MNENAKKTPRIPVVLLLLLLAAAVIFGSPYLKDLFPSREPVAYVCLFPGVERMADADGNLLDGLPFRLEKGTVFVQPDLLISALGGKAEEEKLSLGGITVARSDLPSSADGGYLPLSDLMRLFSLRSRDYGSLVQVGPDPVYLSPETVDSLTSQAGAGPATDLSPVSFPEITDTVDPYHNIDYATLLDDIADLERMYPDLITSFFIGTTLEGREIPAFTFGKGERVIYYGASIHAGEHVTTNVIMDMVERYAQGYRAGEQEEGYIPYRELLDNVTFYIIPQINPDGVNIAQNGYGASSLDVRRYDKQGVSWYGGYKANANGVDLNRNFPYKWHPELENGIDHRCMRYFCGFEANSEPEVQAMVTMAANIPFEMFADFHKFGEEVFWVDTDSMDRYDEYEPIARRVAEDAHYHLKAEEIIEKFGGYASNYMRNVYGRFSMTIETCQFWQYGPAQFDRVNANIWRVGLVMGEELLKREDQVEGLRIVADGRTVPLWEDCQMSDHAISLYQLEQLLKALGGSVSCNDDAVALTSQSGTYSVPFAPSGSLPDGCILLVTKEGKQADLMDLLTGAGYSAYLNGKTIYADTRR